MLWFFWGIGGFHEPGYPVSSPRLRGWPVIDIHSGRTSSLAMIEEMISVLFGSMFLIFFVLAQMIRSWWHTRRQVYDMQSRLFYSF